MISNQTRGIGKPKMKINKTNIIIIQKGKPLQNPAKPVLILQAKPITNIETRAMPNIIVIFSLSFIY